MNKPLYTTTAFVRDCVRVILCTRYSIALFKKQVMKCPPKDYLCNMSTRTFVFLIGSLIEGDAFIVIPTGRPHVARRSHFYKSQNFRKYLTYASRSEWSRVFLVTR